MHFRKVLLTTLIGSMIGCSAETPDDVDDTPSNNNGGGGTTATAPKLTVTSTTISEKDDKASILLKLDKPAIEAVEITMEIMGGNATLGDDYSLLKSIIIIPIGSSRINYEVNIIDDEIDEPAEQIDFKIQSLSNAEINNIGQIYNITINDNDPEPYVSFRELSFNVSENIGVYDLEFHLDRPSAQEIKVDFSVTGTAKLIEDFTIEEPYSITIEPMELSASKSINVVSDNIREGGETIAINLLEGSYYSINEGDRHTIIINGDVNLNDTGAFKFSDDNNISLDSEPKSHPGQDASFGFDTANNKTDIDGKAGFSYTKLDFSGNEIPLTSANWSCIRDNRTGLIWEVKDTELDLSTLLPAEEGQLAGTTNNYRAANYQYTYYTVDVENNGRSAGAPNDKFFGKDMFDIEGYCAFKPENDAIRKYILRCNTDVYQQEVNWYGLCGSKQWRVPAIEEARSIMDYEQSNVNDSKLHIDTDFFPNTKADKYLSSTPSAEFDASVWCLNMVSGETEICHKQFLNPVRLVSDAK